MFPVRPWRNNPVVTVTLVPQTVLAGEDALNNRDHGLMPVWRQRSSGSFAVRGDYIRKQVTRVLFADDLEVRQGNKERLEDAKRCHAIRVMNRCAFCHLVLHFNAEPTPSPRCVN
jgi:hypothetical protein